MAPTFNAAHDLPDLTGKVALVTGATSGLGYAVSQELLRKGATVYLAARSESKAVATISRLESEGLAPGNGKPVWHKLELDNPHEVKKSAEAFLARETRLDILVNNAACLARKYALGPIGVQDVVTINHFSPFIFTKLVLPLLKKTAQEVDADVRIVNITSKGHKLVSSAQFKDKADFNGPTTSNSFYRQLQRYAYSRLLNIFWTNELARRLAESHEDSGDRILCLSLHPGVVATEGLSAGFAQFPWPFSVILHFLIKRFATSPADAAATVLIAAAKPDMRREKEKYHGKYLEPVGKIAEPSTMARDKGLARDLWTLTEKTLAEEGL